MSKKKQTEAAEAEQEKTEAAAEETAEEKTEAAPETEEKPAEAKAEEKPEAPAEQPKDAALAAMNDKYLRLCAEYDNFRKRSQKEKDALYDDIKANTLKSFLPVYDNLVRALQQSTEDEAYKKGVEMIMAQFRATMEKLGVKEMDCLGQKFDPAYHNAVMQVESEEYEEGVVVQEFQKGYMYKDTVLRHSMVTVAK